MGIWAEAFAVLKQEGVWRTFQITVSNLADVFFDVRYGTDTSGRIELEELDIPREDRGKGLRYQATRAKPFRKLMRRLSLPRDSVFVDVGCGKGRVVMLAAGLGFDKVIGIEYSHELWLTANKNAEIFREKTGQGSAIEILECNAAEYPFHGEENVLFFANPFDASVMEQVMGNLETSLKERPRTLWLIYYNAVCHDVVVREGRFTMAGQYLFGGCRFNVYVGEKGD